MSHAYTASEPMRRPGLPLRAEQITILSLLGQHHARRGIDAWARPKDLNAPFTPARTSERLRGLVCRGYAEKEEIRSGYWREAKVFHYRITATGFALLAAVDREPASDFSRSTTHKVASGGDA